jgi:hypothetical protein
LKVVVGRHKSTNNNHTSTGQGVVVSCVVELVGSTASFALLRDAVVRYARRATTQLSP